MEKNNWDTKRSDSLRFASLCRFREIRFENLYACSRHIVSTLANNIFNYDFNPSPPQKGWKWPQSGEKWPILVITWYGRLHYLRFLIISYHQIEDEKIEDVLAKLYLNPFFKGWSSRKLPFYQIFKKIIIIINKVSLTQWKWYFYIKVNITTVNHWSTTRYTGG